MSITASDARRNLFTLIERVNEDYDAIEIVSRHGNAVLASASGLIAASGAIREESRVMSITASDARRNLFTLIKRVNAGYDAIEIVSEHGNAVLVSAGDYSALREGAHLLRSPVNARRLLKAYENALSGVDVVEHELIDPDTPGPSGDSA